MNRMASVGRFVDSRIPMGLAVTMADPWFRVVELSGGFDGLHYTGGCEYEGNFESGKTERELGQMEAILSFYPILCWLVVLAAADVALPAGIGLLAVLLTGAAVVLSMPVVGNVRIHDVTEAPT